MLLSTFTPPPLPTPRVPSPSLTNQFNCARWALCHILLIGFSTAPCNRSSVRLSPLGQGAGPQTEAAAGAGAGTGGHTYSHLESKAQQWNIFLIKPNRIRGNTPVAHYLGKCAAINYGWGWARVDGASRQRGSVDVEEVDPAQTYTHTHNGKIDKCGHLMCETGPNVKQFSVPKNTD